MVLGATGRKVCPIATVLSYMANPRPAVSSASGPFFVFSDGRVLTRERFVKELRAALTEGGFRADDYAGHSFRIGAARTAASHGMPDSLIKTLGVLHIRYILGLLIPYFVQWQNHLWWQGHVRRYCRD